MKCKILGHHWAYGEDEDRCVRCDARRDNPRDITDEDPDAEHGDQKIEVDREDHGVVISIMEYRSTGFGPEDEYRQWSPVGRFTVSDDQVDDLIEELEEKDF